MNTIKRIRSCILLFGVVLMLGSLLVSQAAIAHCKGNHKKDPDCATHDDGTGGGDSGNDISLICFFTDDGNENITGDPDTTFSGAYVDGEQKVDCSTGGTSQPNLSGVDLDTISRGNVARAQRKLDIHLTPCTDSNCVDPADLNGTIGETLFNGAMENATLSIRPYVSDQGHIQSLEDGTYPMAVRIGLKGAGNSDARIVLSIAGRSVLGDIFQGVLCDISPQTPAITSDVPVTVATINGFKRFSVDASAGVQAAICSDIPVNGVPCGGADNSQVCNFHGLVDVNFYFEANDVNAP